MSNSHSFSFLGQSILLLDIVSRCRDMLLLKNNTSSRSLPDQHYCYGSTQKSTRNRLRKLMSRCSTHPRENHALAMLRGFILKVSRPDIETGNAIRRPPTTTSVFAEAIEAIPIQKIVAQRVYLCTIRTAVDVDPSEAVGAGLVSLIGSVVYMLAVEDSRIVCLRVVLVHVLELPGNADLLATRWVEKVVSLVDEAFCGVAAEQIHKVEAVTYDRNASGVKGEGISGSVVAAGVILAV